jgi:hypothetical protein
VDHVSILVISSLPLFDVSGYVYRYRYQLEAFIDKLRGRDPEHWYEAQDSITNMQWIEAIYKEVGHIFSLVPFSLASTLRSGLSAPAFY